MYKISQICQISKIYMCTLKAHVASPPERCDFTSSQEYSNNVMWSLFIMLEDQNSNYLKKFIQITSEDNFYRVVSHIKPYQNITPFV